MNSLKLSTLIVTIITIALPSCKENDSLITTSSNTDITYKAAYVVNGGGNSLSVIDISTNEVKRTITLSNVNFPHHIALSPDKSKMVIGVPGMDLSNGHTGIMTGMAGKFIVLNTINGSILKSQNLPLMNHNAIYSPDGSEIWVAQMDNAGKVLVYNSSSSAV